MINLDMFCNIDLIRYAVINNKIKRAPRKLNLVVSWPVHIVELAKNKQKFELHTALLTLGLHKTGSVLLILPELMGHIVEGVNPDWGSSFYLFNTDKEWKLFLEAQEEMEIFWFKEAGMTPIVNDFAKEWCRKSNEGLFSQGRK